MSWDDWGNAAAGFLGFTGSAYGQHQANMMNRDINRENNVFSANQAQLNRKFQMNMSNTSWQRGMADMKKAGVNPMLAFSQGGASQPTGNSAQGIAQANQQNELAGASQLPIMAAQIANTQALTRKTTAEAINAEAGNPINKAIKDASNNAISISKAINEDLPKKIGGFAFDTVNSAKSFYKRATSYSKKKAADFSRAYNSQ